ncbi:MAG: OsmC family protein [Nitrosopumilus sp.]|nr:OsmC family protein [Nitrosopumilus sp.]MDH5658855.1 OsmC family protein [Nitrosopumilus sp.]
MSTKPIQKELINGVDVPQLTQIIDDLTQNPNLAQFHFCAKNNWVSGGENQTTVNEFYGGGKKHVRSKPFVFTKDEPPTLLGHDNGANPVEYALTALAGCVTTTLVYYASAMNVKINKIESTLEGDIDLRGLLNIDDGIKAGYKSIDIKLKIDSNASAEVLEKLMAIAKKHSPVANTITNGTPINLSLV